MPRPPRYQETVLYPPYAKDIRNVLLDFVFKKTCSFAEFKQVWKKHSFSLIFEGRPDEVDPKLYIQELYNTCLGYLLFNNPSELRSAIIFMLYLLYHTQSLTPKCKINVSLELYEEICRVEVFFRDHKNVEGYQIIQNLKKGLAFNYTASVRVDPLLSSLVAPQETSDEIPQEIREANTVNGINFEQIESQMKKYKESKNAFSNQNIFLPDFNLPQELQKISEKHVNEKEIRKENLEIELVQNLDKKKTPRRSNGPRRQTYVKRKNPNKGKGWSKSTPTLKKNQRNHEDEDDDDDESLEQFENEIGATIVVTPTPTREKRKRTRTIEPIALSLINDSIDDFLSVGSQKSEQIRRLIPNKIEAKQPTPKPTPKKSPKKKKKKESVELQDDLEELLEIDEKEEDLMDEDTESAIIVNMRSNPRNRKSTTRYGVASKVEATLDESEVEENDKDTDFN